MSIRKLRVLTRCAPIMAAGCLCTLGNAAGRDDPFNRKAIGKIAYAWVSIPASHRLRIKVPRPFLTSAVSANIQCKGIAMTGGYTRRNRVVPDGLIVIKGKIVGQDNRRKDGGILELRGSSVSIRRAKAARPAPDAAVDQIYAQPILINDGKIDSGFLDGAANRVALGRYQDGTLFMVMAYDQSALGTSAVTLTRFARDVLTSSGKKVDWLLNFDGGPSAFLYANGSPPVAPGNGQITSYLCAEPADG